MPDPAVSIPASTWQHRVLALANGARFHKCAMQVNPFEYTVRHSKSADAGSETEYNEKLIAALTAANIEVIGVTDHFAIRHSISLIAAAEVVGIKVFPGFEAETKDGIHMLCLFEPGTSADLVQARIHDCGVHSEDEAAQRGKYDCDEFLLEAKKWGALCIAAHATSDKGLLRAMKGGRCAIAVWTNPLLLACSIPGKLDETPPEFTPILKNTNPQYRRSRPLAILNSQDVSAGTDVTNPGATTEIKMSEISIEGLRQAFIDPDARVRRFDQLPETPRRELLAVRWQGGFLDGIELRLNPNLNVLIGGRGTGKSTIVESIRYAMGMSPSGEDAIHAHETLIRHVLKEATTVSILIRTHSPGVHDYWIERIVPNPPQVKELDGSVSALRPLDVVSGLEIFGQHEIAEMVRNRAQLTSLLHRFAPDQSALAARKAELQTKLQRSRSRLVELSEELQQIDDRLSVLPGLKETLQRYKDSGLEEKLKDRALLMREERILRTAAERVEAVNAVVAQLRASAHLDVAFVSESALQDIPMADSLREIRHALEGLGRAIVSAAESILSASAKTKAEVSGVEKHWQQAKVDRQAAYEATLRELQKAAGTIDAGGFGRLHKQICDLEPLGERRDLIRRDLDALRKSRTQLLAEWEQSKAEHFQLLSGAAKKLSRQVEWRVRVTVELGADRSLLLNLLQQELEGTTKPIYERLIAAEGFSLPALVTACRAGTEDLQETFGLTPAQADRLCRAGESVFMRIEELDFPVTTKLELNLSEPNQPPEWRPLEQLSKGQKATAVLLLLLLESDAPLIVDQPEDDLDNRFISDGIVPKIRVGKQRRQFIFATHNANIPVLGDAELITALEASGEPGAGVPAQARLSTGGIGSIDNATVRQLVGEILEGGEAAFEMRRMKYGY